MAFPVYVKSTKRGIQLVLDHEIPFNELKEKVTEKFKAAKEFYKDTQFSLSFSGRALSFEEEQNIIQIIESTTGCEVVCVLEENELLDAYLEKRMEQIAVDRIQKCGQFHKGSILPGQILETESSVIILGDVCTGGKVLSKGNIIVIGNLSGYAYAGVSGKKECFIAALSMMNVQLRIANVDGKTKKPSYILNKEKIEKTPQIARAKEKSIVVEPIRGYLDVI